MVVAIFCNKEIGYFMKAGRDNDYFNVIYKKRGNKRGAVIVADIPGKEAEITIEVVWPCWTNVL